jgi:hypothetical protein
MEIIYMINVINIEIKRNKILTTRKKLVYKMSL